MAQAIIIQLLPLAVVAVRAVVALTEVQAVAVLHLALEGPEQ
jgi:hypothetical protein